MKKATGIVVSMIMMSVMLAGCYNKSCHRYEESHKVSYKGDK